MDFWLGFGLAWFLGIIGFKWMGYGFFFNGVGLLLYFTATITALFMGREQFARGLWVGVGYGFAIGVILCIALWVLLLAMCGGFRR